MSFIYFWVIFSLFLISSVSSKCLVSDIQNGSWSKISNPLNINCGLAAPDVFFRISFEKPNDSTIGNKAFIRYKVPLNSSETTRPLLLEIIAWIFPKTLPGY